MAERLFVHHYYGEIKNVKKRIKTWIKYLPDVINDLNDQVTRPSGLAPIIAISLENGHALPSKYKPRKEMLLTAADVLRYLYMDGELEGGSRRATYPIWSLTKHFVKSSTV